MRIILKIAKAELRNLFYSPVAWIIMVVFFVVSGMQFATPLKDMARMQELAMENMVGFGGFSKNDGLTRTLFATTLSQVLSYLYLFIPLLTMGAISRDVHSGSIKLLYSSPVRTREIVLGKYLALVMFNVVLLSAVALMLLTGIFSIVDVEYKIYLSVMLGLFLLSCTYTAIGLFISCLTNYQIVAAIVTFMLFVVLGLVGLVWQQYDFIRDLTYFLSLSGRVNSMIAGLISTRDVIYFLLIIVLFVGFSIIKLKSTQESKNWTVPFARNLLLFIAVLVLGYFSSRPGFVGYYDVTLHKKNTIDSATQEVLKELDGSKLTATLYVNFLDKSYLKFGKPDARNAYVWGFWEKYLRFYPNIELKYEYFYWVDEYNKDVFREYPPGKSLEEIVAIKAKMYNVDFKRFKKPEVVKNLIDFSNEPSKTLIELEYKGKKKILRTFQDKKTFWPGQSAVAASIRRLVRDTIPQIVYTTGHYERSPYRFGEREYGTHSSMKQYEDAYINLGINLDTVFLAKNDIPSAATVLVVADPKSAYAQTEQQKILDYVKKGGNALFFAEPGKQHVINPILNKLGVNIENGIMIKSMSKTSPVSFEQELNDAGNYLAKEKHMQYFQKYNLPGAGTLFSGSAELTYQAIDGFTIEPIMEVFGDTSVWIENEHYVVDSATATFSKDAGDIQKDKYIVGIKLTRKINGKEQRIIVAADADFMSRVNQNGFVLRHGLHSWLVNNEYPVYENFTIPTDIFLKIGKNQAKVVWNTVVYVVPALLVLMGMLLLIRRSRK